jgi:hypothetical protein
MTNPARNYVLRLFQVQYNLIFVGGAGLFSLASASPWPLLAALGVEALWLGPCSRVPSVRRWVDARDAVESEVENETVVKTALEGLESQYASRVLALEHGLAELKGAGAVSDAVNPTRVQQEVAKVGAAFVRMCHSHQRLGSFVDTLPEAELGEEVQRLKQSFTAEKDLGLRLGIKQSIALAQRRLEQRQKAVSALRNLSLQLDAVERSVSDLRGQARAVGLSLDVAAGIDLLVSELGPESIPPPETDDFGAFAARPLQAAINTPI